MQIDMHYYGTYAMARASGLTQGASKLIATAAQFVDDNAEKESIEFADGGRLDVEATAHHAFHLKNIDSEDQRKIWVPFHFLPGNMGNSYTEKLVCQMNSQILDDMLKFVLQQVHQPYALPLIGIAAHVYADTYSHYGFSGISSRRNKIESDSFTFPDIDPKMEKYISKKAEKFKENYPKEEGLLPNIKSWFAETLSGALGHGAAVTFPDRPYLVWQFVYEDPTRPSPLRKNPDTFLEGANALHEFFSQVGKANPEFAEKKNMKFSSIENTVKAIINLPGKKESRIREWLKTAREGSLFIHSKERIPTYTADNWLNQRDNLRRRKNSSDTQNTDIFKFYQAAAVYRIYVLRYLLPSHGLVVS